MSIHFDSYGSGDQKELLGLYLEGEPKVRHRSGSGPVVDVRVHPDEGAGRGPDILVGILEARSSGREQTWTMKGHLDKIPFFNVGPTF